MRKRTVILLLIIISIALFFIKPILAAFSLLSLLGYVAFLSLPYFYTHKASNLFKEGKTGESLEYFNKVRNMKSASDSLLCICALAYLKSGKTQESLELLDNILKKETIKPQDRFSAKQYKALCLYKLGDIKEATLMAEDLFDTSKHTVTYGMLGLFKSMEEGNEEELLSFCLEAYEYNPKDRDITDNLSVAYIKNSMYEKARELTDNLIESYPNFLEGYYHGALAYQGLGDTKKALALLDKTADCRWQFMTTVTKDEVEALKQTIKSSGGDI